jgi:hypothetical protein
MPNTLDTIGKFLSVLQSGLVVSGNTYMVCERAIVSGDARTSVRVSGYTDAITLRLSKDSTKPMTGGGYTCIFDNVVAELSVHYTYNTNSSNTSSAVTRLDQMVNDYKTTVANGTWVPGWSYPTIVNEEWPLAHEKAAKARLTYHTGYML